MPTNFQENTFQAFFDEREKIILNTEKNWHLLFWTNTKPFLLACALCHDLHLHPQGKRFCDILFFSEFERDVIRSMHQLRQLHLNENTSDLNLPLNHSSKIQILRFSVLLIVSMIFAISSVFSQNFKKLLLVKPSSSTEWLGSLGISAWRRELEDISFSVLHPRYFQKYRKNFVHLLVLIQHFSTKQKKSFGEIGKKTFLTTARKNERNLFYLQKLLLHHCSFREIPDRLAIRIITESEKDCYQILGIVHRLFPPLFSGFKDYIAAPKENGYRSLHTVVFPFPGENTQPIEIQIRTYRMHSQNEFGLSSIAATRVPNMPSQKENAWEFRARTSSSSCRSKISRTFWASPYVNTSGKTNHLFR